MGSSQPATTTQQQNSTTTAAPWTAATPLLQNLINQYGGMSTAVTPGQTAAGQQLGGAAQSLADAGAYAMPYAYNMTPAASWLTPAAYQVAGSTGNLGGAAQNVIGSTAPLTGAAYGEIPAAYAQMPAAYNMMNAANQLPSFAPQSTASVQQMFANAGMLPQAYGNYQANMNPIATMSANPYSTPGFSDALNTLTQNITSQVQGAYAGAGRDPSGAGSMPQTLARGLMQGEAPILQSQYNTNLANIMGANAGLLSGAGTTASGIGNYTTAALQNAGMLPSVAMAPSQAQWTAAQAPLTAAQNIYGAAGTPYQAAMTQYGAQTMPYQAAVTNYGAAGYPLQAATSQYGAAQMPYAAATNYYTGAQAPYSVANQIYAQPYQNLQALLAPSMGLGGMGGTTTAQGYMTGTQTPANNPLSNILGGISGAAGLIGALGQAGGSAGIAGLAPLLMMSDPKAKEDIKPIGKTFDKQNIYSFRLKGSPTPQIGMMADEVERKTPEAVVRGPDNLRRVNYDLATRKAQTMGMMPAYRRAA